jgi:hypothetical protein
MANTDKYFIIGIGGTGMRCIESFTHMCAMGLYDSKEINVLTLDTDFLNGNKQRTESLIEQYNSIKSSSGSEGKANSDTFFSAKINLHKWVANYNDKSKQTFNQISNLQGEGKDSDNKLLADLFLTEAVQDFDLSHGYRAQTHMGSHLMYHAFIETAKRIGKGKDPKEEDKDFEKYLNKLYDAGSDAKVFVFGSIFGGTGASSIPVIPKALNDALSIYGNNTMALDPDVKFGATLLTEYFKFKKPSDAQKGTKKDGVIADSSFFTINSQAALQFYQDDPTVQSTYKKMYHIGWPIDAEDFSKDQKENKTITGGENQKNDCHIVEFICACAAFDFFNSDSGLDVKEAAYLYKSVNYENGKLDFSFDDFIGEGENGKLFGRKFSSFVSLMHLILSKHEGAEGYDGAKALLDRMGESSQDYSSLTSKYTEELTDYFKKFGYSIDAGKLRPGWLYQIKNTVNGKLVLNSKSYTKDLDELRKIDAGKLFDEKELHWKSSLFGGTFDLFIKSLKNVDFAPNDNVQNVSETNERFLAHLYNAIKLSPSKPF